MQAELDEALAALPNPPDPTAADEDEVLYERGEAGREGKDHLELAGEWIDMEAGARVAGSRFAYLKGDLVLLELALVRWTLELLRGKGFEPVDPAGARARGGAVRHRLPARHRAADLPARRRRALPDGHERGRARVAARRARSLDRDALPLRYAGFSPCFRREAGAAGRDTRGLFRVHQFDKVEMFSFVAPEDARRRARAAARQRGGDPHRARHPVPRRQHRASTDLGTSAAKKYDCEAWLPGAAALPRADVDVEHDRLPGAAADIRYRPENGGPRHVATLNGTAVAVGRTLIALVENGQRDDGSVAVPEVLHAWGAPRELRVGAGDMSETPITPDDPDVPEAPPPARRAASPRSTTSRSACRSELDADEAPLPGLPGVRAAAGGLAAPATPAAGRPPVRGGRTARRSRTAPATPCGACDGGGRAGRVCSRRCATAAASHLHRSSACGPGQPGSRWRPRSFRRST